MSGVNNVERKKAFIINTASYERVSFALSMAATSAALGDEVHVFFSYGGILRLRKGHEDEIGEETAEYVRKDLLEGQRKGGLLKISETIRLLRSLGGKIYACPTAMALHNLTRSDLIDDIDEICGVATFLAQNAKDAIIIYV